MCSKSLAGYDMGLRGLPRPFRAPPWVPDRGPARRHSAGTTVVVVNRFSPSPQPSPVEGEGVMRSGVASVAAPGPCPTVGTGSESGKTILRRKTRGGGAEPHTPGRPQETPLRVVVEETPVRVVDE